MFSEVSASDVVRARPLSCLSPHCAAPCCARGFGVVCHSDKGSDGQLVEDMMFECEAACDGCYFGLQWWDAKADK